MTSGESPGSSSFYRRSSPVLLVAFAALALNVAAALWFRTPLGWATWLASLVSVAVYGVPIVAAALVALLWARRGFVRDVLLTVRWTDIALGVGVGLLLRAAVELVIPTTGSLNTGFLQLSALDITVIVVGTTLLTPLAEEIFFRGVIVAALADALRDLGRILAGILAIAISTLVFVMLHAFALGATATMGALLAPLVVGVAAGILFLLTQRLAAAVLAHVVFNGLGVVLLLV